MNIIKLKDFDVGFYSSLEDKRFIVKPSNKTIYHTIKAIHQLE